MHATIVPVGLSHHSGHCCSPQAPQLYRVDGFPPSETYKTSSSVVKVVLRKLAPRSISARVLWVLSMSKVYVIFSNRDLPPTSSRKPESSNPNLVRPNLLNNVTYLGLKPISDILVPSHKYIGDGNLLGNQEQPCKLQHIFQRLTFGDL